MYYFVFKVTKFWRQLMNPPASDWIVLSTVQRTSTRFVSNGGVAAPDPTIDPDHN